MPNIIVNAANLLQIAVDGSQRQCIRDLGSEQSADTFIFTRGDTLKGSLYMVYPTGVPNPLWYQFNASSYELVLSDGISIVYCTATGWEALGGSTNPHQAFNLEVMSSALDNALRLAGDSLFAFLEIHVSGINAAEGSAFPQDQYIVRADAVIQKTALNPVPILGV